MRRFRWLAVVLILAACGDGPTDEGPKGPLDIGVVSGNYQTAAAGEEQLSEPVIGKMVRKADGKVAFHILPALYAQTGTPVTGSPVPGAVVCAVSTTEGGLEPFTPCTNTDSSGLAVFYFEPGTKAGQHMSEIRGTVGSEPAVFDTVFATVEPGPPVPSQWQYGTQQGRADTLRLYSDFLAVKDAFGNQHAWRLETSCCAHPISPNYADWWQSRTLVADSAGTGEVRVLVGDSVHATGTLTVEPISGGRLLIGIYFPNVVPPGS